MEIIITLFKLSFYLGFGAVGVVFLMFLIRAGVIALTHVICFLLQLFWR